MAYNDPIIAKYIDLIQSKGGKIKTFFEGEPIRIGESQLPCVIISKKATRVGPINNAEDQHEMGLQFAVITDIRKDLSTDKSAAALNAGISTLYDIIEGRGENLALKPTALLDILRSNLLVNASPQLRTDLESVSTVEYGIYLSNRGAEEWRVEARVDIISTFVQRRVS